MNPKLRLFSLAPLVSLLLPAGPLRADAKPVTATALPPFTPAGGSAEVPLHRIIGFNDAGELLAESFRAPEGQPNVLVTGRPGALKVVVSQGQTVPGGGGAVFTDDLANYGSLGQDGRVAFHARIGADAQSAEPRYGLFLWEEDALSAALLPGGAVPGLSYPSISPVASSHAALTEGNPLFFATRWDTQTEGTLNGLCSWPPLTALDGAGVRAIALPVANTRGDVFYQDTALDAEHPDPGLRRWRRDGITRIADFKQGSTGFTGFDAQRCNGAGDLAYTASWTDGTVSRQELWFWREGQNRPITRAGDPVPGLPGTSFTPGRLLTVTDDGAVVFSSRLDGEQAGTAFLHWKDGQLTVIAREFMIPDGAPDMSAWFPLGICVADNGAVVIAAQDGSGGLGRKGLWYWEPGLERARAVCVGDPPKINVPGYGQESLLINGNTLNGDLNVGSNSGVCGILNRRGELALGSSSAGLPHALILDARILALGSPPSLITAPQAASAAKHGAHTFHVTAGGTTPQVFQWLKNGQPIPGATGSTLTLTDISYADNGAAYAVAVENALGQITSPGAVLTVREADLDEWRDLSFSPAEQANAAVSGPLADPDGDGTPNLVEFVLGRDPGEAGDGTTLETGSPENLSLPLSLEHPSALPVRSTLRLERLDTASGAWVTVAVKTESGPWQGPVPASESPLSAGVTRSTFTVPTTGAPRQFLRLAAGVE